MAPSGRKKEWSTNNYNDPQAWALRIMRERVKGIPEGQWGWGVGDSVMPLYASHCDLAPG